MLYKRGAVWWCKFKIRGEVVRLRTGASNRAQAAIEETRLKAAYRDRPDVGRGGRCRLSDLEALDLARAVNKGVTDAQIGGLEYQWDHIVEHFGEDRDPEGISFDDLEAFVTAELRRVSGDTVGRMLSAMRRAYTIARRRTLVLRQPLDWPRVASASGKKTRASTAGKWHAPEVIGAWLRSLAPQPRLRALVILATGLRHEEASVLDASWVAPVPPGWGCAALLEVPKVKTRPRTIPLDTEALDLVERYAASERPSSHRTAYELARLRIKYGRTITERDLRHIALTVAEQTDRKAAQDLGGHTTERITNRYLHSDPARLSAAAASLTAFLAGLGGGTIEGGTAAAGSDLSDGGRRGFRTPDILRVSPEAPPDFSNLRSIWDRFGHQETAPSTAEGAREGGTVSKGRRRA